jgi:hypothetical protein
MDSQSCTQPIHPSTSSEAVPSRDQIGPSSASGANAGPVSDPAVAAFLTTLARIVRRLASVPPPQDQKERNTDAPHPAS